MGDEMAAKGPIAADVVATLGKACSDNALEPSLPSQ
jgi:hypothetical protein